MTAAFILATSVVEAVVFQSSLSNALGEFESVDYEYRDVTAVGEAPGHRLQSARLCGRRQR